MGHYSTAIVLFLLGFVYYSAAAPAFQQDVVEDCLDREDCSGYDIHTSCCGAYEAYSRYHCPRHCKFCKPKIPDARLCTDTIPNCNQYGDDLCTNDKYVGFVKTKCAGYCAICNKTEFIPPCAGGNSTTGQQTSAPETTASTSPMTTTSPYNKCDIGGAYKAEGESWETIDCNKRCTCINGPNNTVQCEVIRCPVWIHNCDLIQIEGSCCPILKCNYFNTVHGPKSLLGKK